MKIINSCLCIIITLIVISCSDANVIPAAIVVDDSVDAPPVSGQFKKRALIEDYTGTWCGNCTRVSYAIEKVFENNINAVAVAIHNGNDPFSFAGIQPLKELISPNSALELPQSRINRIVTWTFPEVENSQQVKNLTSNNCVLGLAMNSTVTENNINLDVNIKFVQNYPNLKLVVYLLEDKLYHPQRNYSTYYGGISLVPNFEHNHVLRASLTNIMGNTLIQTSFNQTITKNFTVPIPSNVANFENINFVAFVVDANNQVVNVRAAESNENQTFEENP